MSDRSESYRTGDIATWKGRSHTYTGEVIAAVPVHCFPETCIPPGTYRLPSGGFGLPRNHVSYLVLVDNTIYWPRVCHLRKA